MVNTLLKTHLLTKRYSGFTALEDVNFSLSRGCVHGIIGSNGAGKSTFVKLIFGEIQPTSGRISINGKWLTLKSPSDALNCGISMVSQDFGLIETMTVEENLLLMNKEAKPFLTSRRKEVANQGYITKLLDGINLKSLIEDLSIIERQLVSISKALVPDFDILILDEATSNLDSVKLELLHSILKIIKDQGKSVIFVTHKLEELFEVADSVSFFEDGRITTERSIKSVSKEDLLHWFGLQKKPATLDKFSDESTILLEVDFEENRGTRFSVASGETVSLISNPIGYSVNIVKNIYKNILEHRFGGVYSEVSVRMRSEIKVGFISDDRRIDGFFPEMSVHENLSIIQYRMASKAGIINDKFLSKKTEALIEQLKIRCKSKDQKVAELSGGNQQKVLFGKWLLYDFDLLILVEPTAGIDQEGKLELYLMMSKLKKLGKSFLVVSSDIKEVNSISDRVIDLGLQISLEYSIINHTA